MCQWLKIPTRNTGNASHHLRKMLWPRRGYLIIPSLGFKSLLGQMWRVQFNLNWIIQSLEVEGYLLIRFFFSPSLISKA